MSEVQPSLGDRFRPDGDVDFLVKLKDDVSLGPLMSRYFELEDAVSRLAGRPVDPGGAKRAGAARIELLRAEAILKSAETIFVPR